MITDTAPKIGVIRLVKESPQQAVEHGQTIATPHMGDPFPTPEFRHRPPLLTGGRGKGGKIIFQLTGFLFINSRIISLFGADGC
jgi:hypothetical protein